MNIYMSKPNAEFLHNLPTKQSMSGLVNELLDNYRAGKGPDLFPQFAKEVIETPQDVERALNSKLEPGIISKKYSAR